MRLFHHEEKKPEVLYSSDFCYEDIVSDEVEKDPDLEIYEDEFEMEPYLEGPRSRRSVYADTRKPMFNIWIGIGMAVVLFLILFLIWVALHHEKKVPEAKIPVPVTVIEEVPEETDEEIAVETIPDSPEVVIEDEAEQQTVETLFAFPATEPKSGNSDMEFDDISDSVTAKYIANVHSIPNVQNVDTITGQLQNGEILIRTGINETTGWSRVEYQGQSAYVVTEFVTDDTEYRGYPDETTVSEVTTSDGQIILFTQMDDELESTDLINLRTEPSTVLGRESVSMRLERGTVVHRTGISPDSGWSRVEIDGEVLYVVTGFMKRAE